MGHIDKSISNVTRPAVSYVQLCIYREGGRGGEGGRVRREEGGEGDRGRERGREERERKGGRDVKKKKPRGAYEEIKK